MFPLKSPSCDNSFCEKNPKKRTSMPEDERLDYWVGARMRMEQAVAKGT